MWFRMAMSFCSVSTCKYDAKGPNSKADRACTMKILSLRPEESGFGLWTENGNIDTFMEMIEFMVEDDKRMKEMGERGYRFLCENYTVDKSYKAIMKHF